MARIRNYIVVALAALSLTGCFPRNFSLKFTPQPIEFSQEFCAELKCNSFEEARKNPLLRQGYLNRIISNVPLDCKVFYDFSGKNAGDEGYAVNFVMPTLENDKKVTKSTIHVGRKAFEDDLIIKDEVDLKYLVEVHEYRHFTQYLKGISRFKTEELYRKMGESKLKYEVFDRAHELEALHYELKQISEGRKKISPFFHLYEKCSYFKEYDSLVEALGSSSEFQREFITDVLRRVSDLDIEDTRYLAPIFGFPCFQ